MDASGRPKLVNTSGHKISSFFVPSTDEQIITIGSTKLRSRSVAFTQKVQRNEAIQFLRAKEIFLAVKPDWQVVTSHEVVREYYEFERTSTAAVQAYLQPLVSRYARNLSGKLQELGFDRQTLVMQSNGGLIPLAQLHERVSVMLGSKNEVQRVTDYHAAAS